MFNVLPYTYQNSLKKEYKMRYVAVFCFFIAAAILLAGGFLLPSLFISQVKNQALATEIDMYKKNAVADEEKKAGDEIKKVSEEMKLLTVKNVPVSIHDIILDVAGHKMSGIYMTTFTYTTAQSGNEINIGGIARDRESLLAFKKSFETDKNFTFIDLPITNLTKNKNLTFSIKLKGNF